MNEEMTWIVITINGTYPWPFDTQIFRSHRLNHGGGAFNKYPDDLKHTMNI
jgi:hypothetical protein